MAVTLKITATPGGSTDIADTLSGGSTGADIGQATNGAYAPIVGEQSANGGAKTLYISHNAVVDPVTNVGFYLAAYSGTYGGPSSSSPSADLTKVLDAGASDNGGQANNSDGLSNGLHVDMSYSISDSGQFAPSREQTGQKRVFGKTVGGIRYGLQTAPIPLHQDALFFWSSPSKVAPTAPEAGKIGLSTATDLGSHAQVRFRYYMPSSSTVGGVLQWSLATIYSFTA